MRTPGRTRGGDSETGPRHQSLLLIDALKVEGDKWRIDQLRRAREHATELLSQMRTDLAATRLALERVSRGYFAGASIVFRGAREQLDLEEKAAALLEEACIDCEPTRTAAEDRVMIEGGADALARLWVDMARVDVLQVQGKWREAGPIVAKYAMALRPES